MENQANLPMVFLVFLKQIDAELSDSDHIFDSLLRRNVQTHSLWKSKYIDKFQINYKYFEAFRGQSFCFVSLKLYLRA